MKAISIIKKSIALLSLIAVSGQVLANNIAVSNAKLVNQTSTTREVRFDVSWDNSWRTSTNQLNWDAAWVFIKYKKNGSNNWQHATLNTTGNTASVGSTIDVPADGKGAFVYRSADGSGSNAFNNERIVWNSVADGVLTTDSVNICVFAVEMVYVPSGAFYAGSGASNTGEIYTAPTVTNPYLITSESAITVGTSAGNLAYTSGGGDGAGPIPANFPKGFAAFYCMKHEITQGQYVDFLNYISADDASARYANAFNSARNRVAVSGGVYSTDVPNRSNNYMGWHDIAAYLDWSALRPMTCLEYEKACRGANQAAVANEYAWGNTTITNSGAISNDGTANEAPTNLASNCNYSGGTGLLRAGCFANSASNRTLAGATYYGILNMSGNVWERTITFGNSAGRSFTATHGDGSLSPTGEHNVTTWPSSAAVTGSGLSGGDWTNGALYLIVSERSNHSYVSNTRASNTGGRGVRTAP